MTVNAQLERATKVVAGMSRLAPRQIFHFYDLMAILQEPGALFGECCDKTVVSRPHRRPVDWEEVATAVEQASADHNTTATTWVETLQVAAEVLQERGVKIWRGNPARVEIFPVEVEEAGISYELRIDATHQVADALNDEVIYRLIDRDMGRDGFLLSFVGEWTEADLADVHDVDSEQQPGDGHVNLQS